MRKTVFSWALTLLLAVGATANAHAWTKQDTMWEMAYLSVHLTDWGQTLDIAAQCQSGAYYETNPILGRCPSAQKVNTYFLTTALLHAGVAHALPPKYRRLFQAGTLSMQVGYVANNANIGLKLRF